MPLEYACKRSSDGSDPSGSVCYLSDASDAQMRNCSCRNQVFGSWPRPMAWKPDKSGKSVQEPRSSRDSWTDLWTDFHCLQPRIEPQNRPRDRRQVPDLPDSWAREIGRRFLTRRDRRGSLFDPHPCSIVQKIGPIRPFGPGSSFFAGFWADLWADLQSTRPRIGPQDRPIFAEILQEWAEWAGFWEEREATDL